MAKNIAIFSDGTGNDWSTTGQTNVQLLAEHAQSAIPVHDATDSEINGVLDRTDIGQVGFYDPGVGFEGGDLIGKATGRGISSNIKDAYKFLIRVYEPGDRIFVFGFSRGAYTVRSLAGLVGLTGVALAHPPAGSGQSYDLRTDPARRQQIVNKAYAVYKTGSGKGEEGARKRAAAAADFRKKYIDPGQVDDPAARAVYFIGVWDTVRSLGIPLGYKDKELTLYPHRFHDQFLSPRVPYAFHAMAIDDNRIPFHPTIWNEPRLDPKPTFNGKHQVFDQAWFPGVHGDVGGGVPITGLSNITLNWMIAKTQLPDNPLLFTGNGNVPSFDEDYTPDFYNVYGRLYARLFYRKKWRHVAQGKQKSGEREIEKTGDALLSNSWRGRMQDVTDYNPAHLADHPDFPAFADKLVAARKLRQRRPRDFA